MSGPIPQNSQKNGAIRGKCSLPNGHAACERRSPTTPQKAAGPRIDPPKSVPQSNAARPSATAAAPPPVLPPAVRSGSCGFRTGPRMWLSLSAENARSQRFDLPSSTAPAAASARCAWLDASGTRSRCRHEPPVVTMPAVSQVSLRT
ncbi:hypothetical protein BH11MYX4_BH11MYX4_69850 [soil metagenome]